MPFVVSEGRSDALLRIKLLGGFDAKAGGGVRPFEKVSRKSRALLSYLAMHLDLPIEREQLADLLWEARRDRDPRHNLRQCVMELRKSLAFCPELLVMYRDTVTLQSAFCHVDAVYLVKLAAAGCIDEAAALYAGDLLKNFSLEVETFNAWLGVERSRLAQTAGELFSELARSALSSGDGRKAVAFGERLVTLDPLREDWQRLLLQIYARFCGRNRALAHARQMVSLLRRELNVSPEPETLALLDQIRQRAPSIVPAEVSEFAF